MNLRGRHVHVEENVAGQAAGAKLFGELHRELRGGREIYGDDGIHADGEAGQAVDRALHGRRHGAGIGKIPAGVGAEVDPGDDEVGARADVAADGEADAIGGSAVARNSGIAIGERNLGEAQRLVEGDGVAAGAAGTIGRDGGDLTHGGKGGLQRQQSGREEAVIVRQQNPHVNP